MARYVLRSIFESYVPFCPSSPSKRIQALNMMGVADHCRSIDALPATSPHGTQYRNHHKPRPYRHWQAPFIAGHTEERERVMNMDRHSGQSSVGDMYSRVAAARWCFVVVVVEKAVTLKEKSYLR